MHLEIILETSHYFFLEQNKSLDHTNFQFVFHYIIYIKQYYITCQCLRRACMLHSATIVKSDLCVANVLLLCC
jgi:hypothetical protein